MVDRDSCVSISRQCALLDLPRSTLYYRPATESAENLALMRLIDAQYLKTPYYGVGMMTAYLRLAGYRVNPKRIRRLYTLLGLQGIAPGPTTSRPAPAHTIYPYLLRNVPIERANQVWSSDITYVPVVGGFFYVVAVIDWFSRFVLSWGIRTAWMPASAVRRSKKRSNAMARRTSSIAIKARSSPAGGSPAS